MADWPNVPRRPVLLVILDGFGVNPAKANNAVAVSGKVELSAYTNKAGEPAAGLSIVVDELATLKAKPKPAPATEPGHSGSPFDDDLVGLSA